MTVRQFDNLLANHCAPALAGIKSANLISVQKTVGENLDDLLRIYNRSLNMAGIRMEILCRYSTHTLVLVYQPNLLWRELMLPENRRFLMNSGYSEWHSLSAVLHCLKERCRTQCVPHEIGLFLSYPLEDVIGFIENRQDCKLTGYWKVYSDVPSAQKRFHQFTLCKDDVCRRVQNGDSILRLFQYQHTQGTPT